MSTRPDRERRRAERRAWERSEVAREARRHRVRRLAAVGAVAALVVAIAIAVAVSTSGDGGTAARGTRAAALFRGLKERNGALGDTGAPLVVTEFVDLQCPFCADASKQTLPTLVEDYVRTGKIELEARVLSFLGPDSIPAARVAAGAQRQGRLWPFLEAFYADQRPENSGYVTDAFLRRVAAAAGVDADEALAQEDSAFATRRLDGAAADARRLGVDSTPTFVVSGRGRAPHVLQADPLDPRSVSAALDRELAGR